MRPMSGVLLAVLTMAVLPHTASAQALDSSTPAPQKMQAAATPRAQGTVTPADLQALRDVVAAQQLQIQHLTEQLQHSERAWQQALAVATDAATTAAAAQTQASQDTQTVGALKSDVVGLEASVNSTALMVQDAQKAVDSALQDPLSIHYKGVTFTTGGFVSAESVRRSRALGADLTTPFNSLTMPGASQSKLSEFFGSARQSRPTLFVQGRLNNVELSGYLSGDFLSAGVTSTATQTNSYTLRLRQAWSQAKFDNGWSLLGGQAWSLVTESKAGIAPSDDLGKVNDARPMTIDPAYNVGFTFARQYGIRATKAFGDRVAVAVAVENAQGTLTTHQNGDNFLLGEAGASNSYNTTGTYTFNPAPDIVAKLAIDPGFGHYEVFALLDRFQDRVFPCGEASSSTALCGGSTVPAPNALGAHDATRAGGGVGANARWAFANKNVTFGLHGFGGNGVGRYGTGQLSDLAIHADGTVNLVRGYQGLATLEWRGKNVDIYLYTGAEYAARTTDYDATAKKSVGYGSPFFSNAGCNAETPPNVNTGFTPGALANCTADTRAVVEGTAGFWYRFYNGPKGRFQFGAQYSYVTRRTWSGVGSNPGTEVSPQGLDGMFFTSLRYYLP